MFKVEFYDGLTGTICKACHKEDHSAFPSPYGCGCVEVPANVKCENVKHGTCLARK